MERGKGLPIYHKENIYYYTKLHTFGASLENLTAIATVSAYPSGLTPILDVIICLWGHVIIILALV